MIHYKKETRALTFFKDGKPLAGLIGQRAVKMSKQIFTKNHTVMTHENRLKLKRRRFHALMHVTMMADSKEIILDSYEVESTTEMTEDNLDEIILYLEGLLKQKKQEASSEIREWRYKCLRMMATCGVDTKNWDAVNEFMMNPRIAGKHLYEIESIEELKTLHRKLHNVRDRKEEKAEKERHLALNN